MEPEVALPFSRRSFTDPPSPEAHESNGGPPTILFKVHSLLLSHLSLDIPSSFLSSTFPTQNLHSSLISPMRVNFCTFLVLLGLIILITPGEHLLIKQLEQPPVSSFPLVLNVPLNAVISTSPVCVLLLT